MSNVTIRSFHPSDSKNLFELFKNAVFAINSKNYDPEQIAIWANSASWQNNLTTNITLVAEYNQTVIGFTDMTPEGHLEHFYIHKDYTAAKGNWVALKLFRAIELKARDMGLTEIKTYCSITAKKPAERMGFIVLYQNTATKNGVTFINYFMKKAV